MNFQEITTYIIVTIAGGFALFSLYNIIAPKKKTDNHGCSSACNCDAKIMRKDLLSKKKVI